MWGVQYWMMEFFIFYLHANIWRRVIVIDPPRKTKSINIKPSKNLIMWALTRDWHQRLKCICGSTRNLCEASGINTVWSTLLSLSIILQIVSKSFRSLKATPAGFSFQNIFLEFRMVCESHCYSSICSLLVCLIETPSCNNGEYEVKSKCYEYFMA